jgi:uncharacterized repeat protein (TIGR01451 family)
MFAVALLLMCCAPLAHAVVLVQDFYLPMPEQQIYQANSAIVGGTGSTYNSTFSIVVTANGTVVYYDQWEDSYETDLANPLQSSTKVWGDGNNANGIPPGFINDPLGLPSGTIITLTNNVTLPRNPSTLLWDARDRVAATKALVISRAAWPVNPGPVFAGAVGVLSTLDYGTNYISPVGQDMTNGLFRYVGMFVMAAQNNTLITLDPNGTGVGVTNIVLNQGESYLINGGIKKGGRITSTKPVQADLLIGHVGATYASDWFTLYPVEAWDSSYYTPVGTSASGNPTYVYLYNPNSNAIAVTYTTKIGSGTINVPGTNGVSQFLMPTRSGARFVTASGQKFFPISTVGANPSSDTAYNWGFTLVPKEALTTEAAVGWGPGSENGTVNGNPAWATALANTRLYVDLKGDHTGPLTDPNGNHYDVAYDVTALQSQTIYDPSKNQTGMRIYTVDGTLLTAAWGEDPDVAAPGNPYIDAGTTVLPFPVPLLTKSAVITNDVNPPGLSVGDTVEYTVQVDNKGLLPLGNTVVIDAPSANLTYVPNSTKIDGNSLPDSPFPDTPFPLDGTGYTIPVILRSGSTTFSYRFTVGTGGAISNTVNIGGYPITSTFVIAPPPSVTPNCTVTFTGSNGVPVSQYAVGASAFVTMTNNVGNTSSNTTQSISVTVQNLTRGDVETITLSEVGTNSNVFINLAGLLLSSSAGLGQQDGTMNVLPGDVLSVAYTDPNFGNSASNTVAIQVPTQTKVLYLSGVVATNTLYREDPVAFGHGPAIQSALLGSTGSNSVVTIDASSTNGSSSASSLTIAHTTGTGTNRLMLVGVGIGKATGSLTTVTNVTCAGRNLAFVGVTNEANTRCEIWCLTNPPSGLTNVTVMLAAAKPVVATVSTFAGVSQSTPLGAFAGNTFSTKSKAATNFISSASGELVYSVVAVDGDNSTPASALDLVAGAGQTVLATNRIAGNFIATGASTKPGAANVTNLWTWTASAQQWSFGAVSIKPAFLGAPGNSTVSFTQTPAFTQSFSLPAGVVVAITNFVAVTSGSMPANPAITATLRYGTTNILTLSNPTYSAVASNLVWSGTLGSNITIPAGQSLSYVISNNQAAVAYRIEYDSTNKPSKITLPTTTVIHIASLDIYDAPYPGGSIVSTPVAGSPLYVRTSVTDPFGSYDITSLGLAITAPDTNANVNVTLNNANVVATNGTSKTYEYAWQTGPVTGGYNIVAVAHEGSEGITDTAAASVSLIFLDLGTPSSATFTGGLNGTPTNGFAPNSTLYFRVTDLNRNTNSTITDTVTVTMTSSAGDIEVVVLTETGVDTGVFVGSLPSSTSVNSVGTLYSPVGSILTMTYQDPTDANDTTDATATILPPPGVPGVAINTTLVSPASSQVAQGQPITVNVQVVNTGSTALTNLLVTNNFPAGLLAFQSANILPDTTVPGGLAWTNVGPLTPGQSVNYTITLDTVGSGVATNTASVSGSSVSGSSTILAFITHASVNVGLVLLNPTNSPVPVGSNVVVRATIQNTGNTSIPLLPLEGSFSSAYYEFVSATISEDGSGAGTLVWTNLAGSPLATNDTITFDLTLKVVGAGNPADITMSIAFAQDIYNNAVPPASTTLGIVTAAGRITGHIYRDNDQSGTLTPGDAPLGSVTVQLFTDPDANGDPSDGTLQQIGTTDPAGYYELLNLDLGNYVIVETDPAGFASTMPVNNRISVVLASLATNANNDFFDYQPAPALYSTLGGVVWSDANQNGTNDVGETGVADVTIDLFADANTNGVVDSGEPIVASVTTGTNGVFTFVAITPGSYVIYENTSSTYYGTGTNQIGLIVAAGTSSTNNFFFAHLNQAPTPTNDTASTLEGVSVVISPLANDADPDGNPLSLNDASATNGTAVIQNGTNVLFTPAIAFIGTAYVTCTIADNHGATTSSLITITVNGVTNIWHPNETWTVNVNDAAGPAGAGYTQTNYTGVLDVQSVPSDPFVIRLVTTPGIAANFDNNTNYQWTVATTTRGVEGFGPGDVIVDNSQFSNDLRGGVFSVVTDGSVVSVVFTSNHSPAANPAGIGRAWGTSLRIPIDQLLTNFASDPDGDGVGFIGIGTSTNGSWLSTNQTTIVFAPTNNFPESFSYVVRDLRAYRPGDTIRLATNWITIGITNAVGTVQSISTSGSAVTLRLAGVPGYAYDVERAASPIGPWTAILTTNAPRRGVWEFVDPSPPSPSAYYRLKQH